MDFSFISSGWCDLFLGVLFASSHLLVQKPHGVSREVHEDWGLYMRFIPFHGVHGQYRIALKFCTVIHILYMYVYIFDIKSSIIFLIKRPEADHNERSFN